MNIKLLGYIIDKRIEDQIIYYNIVLEIEGILNIKYITKNSILENNKDIRNFLTYLQNKDKEYEFISADVPDKVVKRLESELLKEDI